jgi:hypothetical protein
MFKDSTPKKIKTKAQDTKVEKEPLIKSLPPLKDIEKLKLQSELLNESEKARKFKADFDELYASNQILLKEKAKLIHDEIEKSKDNKLRETNEIKEEKEPIPVTVESVKKRRMSNASTNEDIEVCNYYYLL